MAGWWLLPSSTHMLPAPARAHVTAPQQFVTPTASRVPEPARAWLQRTVTRSVAGCWKEWGVTYRARSCVMCGPHRHHAGLGAPRSRAPLWVHHAWMHSHHGHGRCQLTARVYGCSLERVLSLNKVYVFYGFLVYCVGLYVVSPAVVATWKAAFYIKSWHNKVPFKIFPGGTPVEVIR